MIEAVIEYAKFLGALATIVVSIGVLAKVRPARWLVRTLVGEPVGKWARAEVERAIADSEVGRIVKHHLIGNGDTPRVLDQVCEINTRLDAGDRHFRRLEARVDRVERGTP